MKKSLLFLSALLCLSVSALDRTRVIRTPVGTSGAITSITVQAYFYAYNAEGAPIYKYLMEWSETTAGALSGARTVKIASMAGSYGSPQTITSTFSGTWVPQFVASWDHEADTGAKYADFTPAPLTGSAWFAAPNDTLTYIQDTWLEEGEGGTGDDPGWTPPASTSVEYVATVPYVGSGSLTFHINTDPVFVSGVNTSVVSTHCRGTKAFARAENVAGVLYVFMCWDEAASADTAIRYYWLGSFSGGVWGNASTLGLTTLRYNVIPLTGGAATGQGSLVLHNGGGSNTSSFTYQGGTGSYSGAFGDYRDIIARWESAYDRDHGGGGRVAALAACQFTGSLQYWPSVPSGALAYNYTAANNAAPLFDRCANPTADGEPGSPGAGSFPTAAQIADAIGENLSASQPETGTYAPGDGTQPGNAAAVFGSLVGSWESVIPTSQTAAQITITIPRPGSEENLTATLSSIPDTETDLGSAINAFRLLLRTVLSCCVVYAFVSRVYRDAIMY